jgi:hypothetical protein
MAIILPRRAALLQVGAQVGADVLKHKLGYSKTSDRQSRGRGKRALEERMRLGKATLCAAAWRGRAKRASIALLLTVMALCWSSAQAAPPPKSQAAVEESSGSAQTMPEPQVRDIAEQAVRRLDLQTELLREPELFGWQIQLPPEVLWLVVIVGVGVLLYAFRDMIPALRVGRDGAWADEEAGSAELPTQPPAIALGAADALAAQGHFAEAMHVLLLHALAVIRRRLDEPFADSMTSREILRSRQLPDGLRAPLREVVSRVEWSYFGEHPAARDDYAACRTSFATLAQALHGGAAA